MPAWNHLYFVGGKHNWGTLVLRHGWSIWYLAGLLTLPQQKKIVPIDYHEHCRKAKYTAKGTQKSTLYVYIKNTSFKKWEVPQAFNLIMRCKLINYWYQIKFKIVLLFVICKGLHLVGSLVQSRARLRVRSVPSNVLPFCSA